MTLPSGTGEKVLADILRVKVFEASESLAVKENQDGDDLGIGKPSRLIAMLLAITELMLLCSEEKYLQKSSARQKISVILLSVIIAVNACKCYNWTL